MRNGRHTNLLLAAIDSQSQFWLNRVLDNKTLELAFTIKIQQTILEYPSS